MNHLRTGIIITMSVILIGLVLNIFLIPHQILTGGLAGIAILLHKFVPINTGWIVFILNLPLFAWGYRHLGKRFIYWTIYGVILLSVSMRFIPVSAFHPDLLLSSVIGGALFGVGVGLVIRLGGSCGGVDIVALVLSKQKDMSVGNIFTIVNLGIVVASAYIYGIDKTLYTVIAIYVSGRTVDMVHTSKNKLTVTIITENWDKLSEALINLHVRGVTITEAEGAYTHTKKKILTTVITRYELTETKEAIKKIDPRAFVNITQTLEVMGNFRKD
jgi:uncharacterized membrane-anchored protein YitT (DUF2179 family)